MATLSGAGLGLLVQAGVAEVLRPLLPVALPAPSAKPIVLGLTTGMVCLLSFALPPLLTLRNADPVRVIRRDLETANPSSLVAYGFGGFGTFGLMWWYSQDLRLTLLLFIGGLVAVVILGMCWDRDGGVRTRRLINRHHNRGRCIYSRCLGKDFG